MRKLVYKVVKANKTSTFAKGKYCKKYVEGETIKSHPITLGIMVFKFKRDAEKFKHSHSWQSTDGWTIKRVLPIGRGKTVEILSSSQGNMELDYFYENYNSLNNSPSYIMFPPVGTMCYPAVKVLE